MACAIGAAGGRVLQIQVFPLWLLVG